VDVKEVLYIFAFAILPPKYCPPLTPIVSVFDVFVIFPVEVAGVPTEEPLRYKVKVVPS